MALFQAIVILALIVLALPERRVLDPDPDDPDDPDRPDAPEVPHFLDLTQVATAATKPIDSMGPAGSTSTRPTTRPTTPPTTRGAALEDSHDGYGMTKDASNDAGDESTGVNP